MFIWRGRTCHMRHFLGTVHAFRGVAPSISSVAAGWVSCMMRDAAKAEGVLHLEIKPATIFVNDQNVCK